MVFIVFAEVILSIVVLFLFVLLSMTINAMLEDQSTIAVEIFMSITIIVIAGVCIYAIKALERARNKKAKVKSTKNPKPLVKGSFDIVSGLPIPAGTKCKIELYPDLMKIEALGQLFTLEQHRIFNVSTIKKTQIQKQYVSSAGGAVAGAIMAGAVGAIIGGSTKAINVKNSNRFLVFSYLEKDGDETKYLIFAVKDGFGDKSGDFVYPFKDRSKNVQVTNSL